MKSKNLLVYIVLFVVLIGIILGSVLLSKKQESGLVNIKGLTKCSQDIENNRTKEIETKLYALVKSANDYNKRTTSGHYQAIVRDGSCSQASPVVSRDNTGVSHTVRTSTIIVDIPDTKQSWKITYDWIKTGESRNNIDLGTITPTCLNTDQLKYGDFKCTNILSLAQFGTDKPDPILQYMPYTGVGFRMEYDSDTKTVSVFFDPPPGTTDPAAFITNTKAIIPYWFKKRNLDQSNYKIIYSDQIDSPDDSQQ